MPFSTYLFDLDGTLIDSIDLIMCSFRHTMKAHLGEIPLESDWRSGFGTPLRTQLARFARNQDEVEAMASTYRIHNDAHHDQMVKPYPGVHEVLIALRAPGRKFAIVTSKNRRAMDRGLRLCNLVEFFDVCVTTDDVDQYKPNPAPVREALRRLSAIASDTVFIGDSPHDIAAGRAAGVHTAAALWGPFERQSLAEQQPDFWLKYPHDLEGLVRQSTEDR